MKVLVGAVVLSLVALDAQADTDCSLDGRGDLARCERLYLYSRLAATAVPSYVVRTDGVRYEHGLSWAATFDIARDFWKSYFTLKPLRVVTPENFWAFNMSFSVSVAWFPSRGLVEGRAVLRSRMLSLPWPLNPMSSGAHLSVGIGAFFGSGVAGPRLELRLRLGHLAWGGLVIAAAFQPQIEQMPSYGELLLGFEAPWVWWW